MRGQERTKKRKRATHYDFVYLNYISKKARAFSFTKSVRDREEFVNFIP